MLSLFIQAQTLFNVIKYAVFLVYMLQMFLQCPPLKQSLNQIGQAAAGLPS